MIGIGVGLAGVLLLVRGEAFGASAAALVAIVTATVCWSVGSVLSQHVFPLAPRAAGYSSEMICGGVFLLLLSLATGETFQWPPAVAASYSFVNPVIAMLLDISLGGETVTQYEWLAVGIIVTGVIVLILGRR